ncbi:MAG: ATP-binding protein [Bacteroidales bacterium]|nr:ATP-binding protein [Bacteroidales bacterium]
MDATQTILNTLMGKGVYFWDLCVDEQTLTMSEGLCGMLGFENTKLTVQQLLLKMPEDFRADMMKLRPDEVNERALPISAVGGIVWLSAQKLQEYRDGDGYMHYLGTARQMTEEEVGERAVANIGVETLEPMMKSFNLMSDLSTFYEGVHQLLSTIRMQMVGVRAGMLRWDGGDMMSILDYVGGTLIDRNGSAVSKLYPLYSRWIRKSCETGETIVLDRNTGLGDKWELERRFLVRNGVVSAIISPIKTDDGKIWGVLGVLSPTRHVWSAFDKQWLIMISKWVAICLNRLSLLEKMNDQLYLTNEACHAGNMTTWTWDCLTDERVSHVHRGREMLSMKSANEKAVSRKIHSSDLVRFNRALESIALGETDTLNMRVRIRSLETGKMEWNEVRGKAAGRRVGGMPVQVVGVSRSIEEEIRQNQKKKQETELQNSIYNKMPAAIEFFNSEGVLTYINNTAVELFGMSSVKSALGLNIYENPNLTDEQKQEIREKDEVSYAINYNMSIVHYATSKSGMIELIYKMSKLYTKGELTGYMVVVTDNSNVIRQAKQIDIFQRYFLEIGKFAKVGVCWFSDTKSGYVSEQWNINLGVSADQPYVRSLTVLDRVVDEDLEVYGSLLGRIFVGDIESFQYELRVNHSDGMMHYIKVQFVRSSEAITGISIDITQTKENEKMLIEARHKAEKADMLKSQFLANMSHEIRTPLNAIVGFSDLISSSVESNEATIYSEIVHANNDLLLNIIESIMDLSQIEAGTLEVEYSVSDVNTLIDEVHKKCNYVQRPKVDFVTRKVEGELRMCCDGARISKILEHFVNNAFKFTATGKVEMGVERVGNDVVFSVSDTGCGIAASQIDRVFDPYVKLDVFSVGTGLGLSICRGLAKEMGGKVKVRSTEGEGSTFELILPYIDPSDLNKHKAARGKDIMLLCNNNETIQFVSYALDGRDLIVDQEHVFMSLWLEKKPSLTIVDQQLFGDSTSVVVASLRSYGPEHKVIVLYATGPDIDVEAIESAGASVMVKQPISSEKFKSIVIKILKEIDQEKNIKEGK